MGDIYTGMTVQQNHRRVGVVEEVASDAGSGSTRVIVRRDDGERQLLIPGSYRIDNNVLHIHTGASENTLSSGTHDRSTGVRSDYGEAVAHNAAELHENNLTIPVIEEQAVIGTREVERGGVRVHKTTNEREEVVQQPVFREDVDVERVTIGRVVDRVPDVREEGTTLIIPVVEEMLVVEKRLVLKEEVRITRRRVDDTEEVRVMLREEQVEIEPLHEREAS